MSYKVKMQFVVDLELEVRAESEELAKRLAYDSVKVQSENESVKVEKTIMPDFTITSVENK